MARPPIITSPYLRRELKNRGLDPNDPALAQAFLNVGTSIGAPPPTGFFSGDIPAFARGFGRGLANTAIGLADLPLALGRAVDLTDKRLDPLAPSPVEIYNSISSGLGQFGSVLIPFMGAARLARAIPGMRALLTAGEIESALGTGGALRYFDIGKKAANLALTRKALMRLAARRGVQGGLAAGLGPFATASRAAHIGTTMGLVGMAQPGDLDQRVEAAFHGLKDGIIFGSLAATPGQSRLQAVLRETVAGAAGPPPLDIPGFPDRLGGALFGGLLGGLFHTTRFPVEGDGRTKPRVEDRSGGADAPHLADGRMPRRRPDDSATSHEVPMPKEQREIDGMEFLEEDMVVPPDFVEKVYGDISKLPPEVRDQLLQKFREGNLGPKGLFDDPDTGQRLALGGGGDDTIRRRFKVIRGGGNETSKVRLIITPEDAAWKEIPRPAQEIFNQKPGPARRLLNLVQIIMGDYSKPGHPRGVGVMENVWDPNYMSLRDIREEFLKILNDHTKEIYDQYVTNGGLPPDQASATMNEIVGPIAEYFATGGSTREVPELQKISSDLSENMKNIPPRKRLGYVLDRLIDHVDPEASPDERLRLSVLAVEYGRLLNRFRNVPVGDPDQMLLLSRGYEDGKVYSFNVINVGEPFRKTPHDDVLSSPFVSREDFVRVLDSLPSWIFDIISSTEGRSDPKDKRILFILDHEETITKDALGTRNVQFISDAGLISEITLRLGESGHPMFKEEAGDLELINSMIVINLPGIKRALKEYGREGVPDRGMVFRTLLHEVVHEALGSRVRDLINRSITADMEDVLGKGLAENIAELYKNILDSFPELIKVEFPSTADGRPNIRKSFVRGPLNEKVVKVVDSYIKALKENLDLGDDGLIDLYPKAVQDFIHHYTVDSFELEKFVLDHNLSTTSKPFTKDTHTPSLMFLKDRDTGRIEAVAIPLLPGASTMGHGQVGGDALLSYILSKLLPVRWLTTTRTDVIDMAPGIFTDIISRLLTQRLLSVDTSFGLKERMNILGLIDEKLLNAAHYLEKAASPEDFENMRNLIRESLDALVFGEFNLRGTRITMEGLERILNAIARVDPELYQGIHSQFVQEMFRDLVVSSTRGVKRNKIYDYIAGMIQNGTVPESFSDITNGVVKILHGISSSGNTDFGVPYATFVDEMFSQRMTAFLMDPKGFAVAHPREYKVLRDIFVMVMEDAGYVDDPYALFDQTSLKGIPSPSGQYSLDFNSDVYSAESVRDVTYEFVVNKVKDLEDTALAERLFGEPFSFEATAKALNRKDLILKGKGPPVGDNEYLLQLVDVLVNSAVGHVVEYDSIPFLIELRGRIDGGGEIDYASIRSRFFPDLTEREVERLFDRYHEARKSPLSDEIDYPDMDSLEALLRRYEDPEGFMEDVSAEGKNPGQRFVEALKRKRKVKVGGKENLVKLISTENYDVYIDVTNIETVDDLMATKEVYVRNHGMSEIVSATFDRESMRFFRMDELDSSLRQYFYRKLKDAGYVEEQADQIVNEALKLSQESNAYKSRVSRIEKDPMVYMGNIRPEFFGRYLRQAIAKITMGLDDLTRNEIDLVNRLASLRAKWRGTPDGSDDMEAFMRELLGEGVVIAEKQGQPVRVKMSIEEVLGAVKGDSPEGRAERLQQLVRLAEGEGRVTPVDLVGEGRGGESAPLEVAFENVVHKSGKTLADMSREAARTEEGAGGRDLSDGVSQDKVDRVKAVLDQMHMDPKDVKDSDSFTLLQFVMNDHPDITAQDYYQAIRILKSGKKAAPHPKDADTPTSPTTRAAEKVVDQATKRKKLAETILKKKKAMEERARKERQANIERARKRNEKEARRIRNRAEHRAKQLEDQARRTVEKINRERQRKLQDALRKVDHILRRADQEAAAKAKQLQRLQERIERKKSAFREERESKGKRSVPLDARTKLEKSHINRTLTDIRRQLNRIRKLREELNDPELNDRQRRAKARSEKLARKRLEELEKQLQTQEKNYRRRLEKNLEDDLDRAAALEEQIVETISGVRQERDALLDEMAPLEEIIRAQDLARALSKFGKPNIGKDFYNLPPELMYRHTTMRLRDPAVQAVDGGALDNIVQMTHRINILRRLVRGLDRYGETETRIPFTAKVLRRARTSARIVGDANRLLREMLGGRGKITEIEITYGKDAQGRQTVHVLDRKQNLKVNVPNEESALLVIDKLLHQRRNAPSADPPVSDFRSKTVDDSGGPNPPRRGDFDGENMLPPDDPPNLSPSNRLEFTGWRGWFARHVGVASHVIPWVDREFKRLFGRELGLTKVWNRALARYTMARKSIRERSDELAALLRKHKIRIHDYDSRARLGRAAGRLSDELTDVQYQAGETAARAEGVDWDNLVWQEKVRYMLDYGREAALEQRLEKLHRIAREEGLAPGEMEFLIDFMDDFMPKVFEDLGIDPRMHLVGYYSRLKTFAGGLGTVDEQIEVDPLRRDYMKAFMVHGRTRQGEVAPEIDSIRKAVIDELNLPNEYDFLSNVLTYINVGYRVKHLSEPLSEFQAIMLTQSPNMGPAIQDFVRRVVRRLAGELSPSELRTRSTKAERRLRLAKRLKKLNDEIDRRMSPSAQPYMKPVVKHLENLVKRFGIQATTGQVGSWLDEFVRWHRSSIFGLNVMRAVRDAVTTDFFMIAPRYKPSVFARAFTDVVFNRKKRAELLEQYMRSGQLDVDLALPELSRIDDSRGAAFERAEAKATFLYRRMDIHSRLLVLRANELAMEEAIKVFRKTGSWEDFLEHSGLDTLDPSYGDSIKEQILALRGDLEQGRYEKVVMESGRIMQTQAVFNYLRPNAPMYYDYPLLRFFGQYGTWPINAVSSLYWMAAGPWKNYGGRRAARRSAEIALKYAVAAEAVYALGAAFNVDTSDWVPWVHNLWYEGGPGLSLFDKVRDIISDEPIMARRLEREPGMVLFSLVRRAVPLPFAGDVLKRAAGQFIPDMFDPHDKKIVGIPEQAESWWDRMIILGGFFPFDTQLSSFEPGPIKRAVTAPFRKAQDVANKVTGEDESIIPPGSREESLGYRPLIKRVLEE